METTRALEILRALADGKNPYTGETLPADSAYQQADTVRALTLAMEAIESKKKREDRRKELPPNIGRPWTQEDDEWIAQGFDDGASIPEMAESHGRTAGAIRSRLLKLGKLQPEHK